MGQSLRIDTCTATLFASIDFALLINENEIDHFVLSRTEDEWLDKVVSSIGKIDDENFRVPVDVISQYAKTDRGPRNTFPTKHAKCLLPKKFCIRDFNFYIEGPLKFYVSEVYISPQGALTFRIHVEKNIDELIAVVEFIDAFNRLINRRYEIIEPVYKQFCAYWNNSASDLKLVNDLDSHTFHENVTLYDIIDLDCKIRRGNRNYKLKNIKELYHLEELTPIKELAAISRMSIASATSLKDVSFKKLQLLDIGGRQDELWTVGKDRMVRRHPDRMIAYNIAFFDDIKEAVGILNAQQAVFNFLTDWINEKRATLVRDIVDPTENKSSKELQEEFGKTTRLTSLLVNPLLMEKNVKHEFYQKVMQKLVISIGIDENRRQAIEGLQYFENLIGTISGFSSHQANIEFNKITEFHQNNSKKQNFILIVLTIIMILMMFIQMKDGLGVFNQENVNVVNESEQIEAN